MAKVAISVGHTPSDPGSQANGETEFNIASKIGAEVISILQSRGVEVFTVPFDADLAATIDWINRGDFSSANNDVCIDIHVNDGGQSGIEGWHKDRGQNKSFDLTKAIVDAAAKQTGLPNLGAKSEYDHPFGKLAFVHNTNCVSALIECGYLDNPTDFKLLKAFDGIKKFATGIADGIEKFLAPSDLGKKQLPVAPPLATPPTQPPAIPPPQPRGQPFPMVPGAGSSERREMVKRLYREILGKEADPKGLSYYMYQNPTITEDQIRKDMVQSTEHLGVLKNARKAKKMKEKVKTLEEEVSMTHLALEAKENEIANMQKLLQMKSQEISRTRQQIPGVQSVPEVQGQTQMFDSQADLEFSRRQAASTRPQPSTVAQVESQRRKGCFGWIREVFGF